MPRVRKQQFPKDMSTQKVSGMSTAPFLEYPCFIVENRCFFFFNRNDSNFIKEYHLEQVE